MSNYKDRRAELTKKVKLMTGIKDPSSKVINAVDKSMANSKEELLKFVTTGRMDYLNGVGVSTSNAIKKALGVPVEDIRSVRRRYRDERDEAVKMLAYVLKLGALADLKDVNKKYKELVKQIKNTDVLVQNLQ